MSGGTMDANATQPGTAVPALSRFRGQDDQGNVVKSTAPMPPTKSQEGIKYYICTERNASMHRPDGKRLPFIDGFLGTDLLWDQRYLDGEIEDGHPNVRFATENEINSAQMRLDPVTTVTRKVSEDLQLRLRQKMAEKLGVAIEEIPLLDSIEQDHLAKEVVATAINDDERKIAGTAAVTEGAAALLAKLKAGTAVRSEAGGKGATVHLNPTSSAASGNAATSNQS